MGILDRLHKVVTGVGGALQAPVGLVKDIAVSPWKDDDEFDGIVNTLYRRTAARGGQLFGNLLGPQEGVGAIIGGLPAGIRNPVRAVTEPVLDAAESAYREGISEPISGAVTAASLWESDTFSEQTEGMSLLEKLNRTRRDAYRIAQDRSPGQSIALTRTEDILDDQEVAEMQATDAYEIISGTFDALHRVLLDPTVIGGKLSKVARAEIMVRPIRTAADIDKAMDSGRIAKLSSALDGKSAAEIRHQFFPDHRNGAVVASVLADAGDEATRASTLRALMGDKGELDRIRESRGDLAGRIDRATSTLNEVGALERSGFELPLPVREEVVRRARAEIDAVYPEQERLARAEASFATLQAVPRVSLAGQARTALTRSDFYQSSPFAKPMRAVFDMNPQRLVNLHDQSGDIHIHRMLQRSELDLDTQDAIRGEYMAAITPHARQAVLLTAEEQAVRSIAEKAGMGVDEIESVLAKAAQSRGSAAEVLKGRVYDGEGRSLIRFADESGTLTEMHLPLWVSQEANVLPLADLDLVRDAASAIGRFRLRHPSTEVPGELLDKFYRVWKPATLLRLGWPIRVVGDEQLRIIAKIGALAQFREVAPSLRAAATDTKASLLGRVGIGGGVDSPTLPAGFRPRGYEIEGAFGVPGDAANVYEHLSSSRASFEVLAGLDESKLLGEMRKSTGEWKTILPDEAGYGEAWERAVNLQIGQDTLGRMFLDGATVDDAVTWMTSTAEGQAYAARMPGRKKEPRLWAEHAKEQVDSYLPTDELRASALAGTAKADDLAQAVLDPAGRPTIHGEILQGALGGTQIGRMFRDVVDTAYRKLGAQPSDVLSRHPFFSAMYKAEAKRLVDVLDDQARAAGKALDSDDVALVQSRAREYALGETRRLLYDLAESSRMSETLRFLMPFYSAWQEVITRWAGLGVENPAFIARARLVWNSPENAGWITDENGNRVDENGRATDANGNVVEAGSDRYLTMTLPDWARKNVPGLRDQGDVRFNKQSFNMALQGPPGFGPPVQIAVNEIVKNRPELEDSAKFILPFGTTQETLDLVMPAAARRARALSAGEDDRVYANALKRIWQTKLVDYNLGKTTERPTYEQAKKETDAYFKLRLFASYTLPAAPSFASPYQLYIDAYRSAQTRLRDDPSALADANGTRRSADEWFLDTYGPEFFVFTESLSRSMDGVPPTLEGAAARKRYKDMIEKYPEMGSLIIGAEGAGEFSRAVYDAQLNTRVKPGSKNKQRESGAFEDFERNPTTRLGWIEYGRAMDLVDSIRIQRGLPNLQVKAAADLAMVKQAITEKLAEQYPDWYNDFSVVDRNAMDRRIEAMREIVADKRLSKRPDIAGLADYLEARDLMSALLSTREAKTLAAVKNQDLAMVWETIKGKLVEQNLAFGDLYYRYLENDMPEVA